MSIRGAGLEHGGGSIGGGGRGRLSLGGGGSGRFSAFSAGWSLTMPIIRSNQVGKRPTVTTVARRNPRRLMGMSVLLHDALPDPTPVQPSASPGTSAPNDDASPGRKPTPDTPGPCGAFHIVSVSGPLGTPRATASCRYFQPELMWKTVGRKILLRRAGGRNARFSWDFSRPVCACGLRLGRTAHPPLPSASPSFQRPLGPKSNSTIRAKPVSSPGSTS